ncbi:MAG: rhodanese-like domain-containing protein [Proteobacteria bacterium]|nr:rhodanese-like domain-containing protein [Pseudomonadota bacterium]MBU1389125.1 rhodanese-like domain-containing protein [Pseudomonadota bacterium]MBU1543349.1 rhodanese-like domain-containing protein [Pseudomonadota bacterium]MBU2480906.1 rhodanese-like domain-containing protein [Pseudomonadota bacterium]
MTFKHKKGIQKEPGVIKGVIVLVFFALVTAFIFNTLSPHRIALFGQWDPQKGVISANPDTSGAGHFTQIHSSKQVADMIRGKNCLIIDVRARDLFEQGHIPTALSFPINEFDENLPGMTARINQHDPVLLYCSSVYCTDSHTFADYLKSMGYKDIKIFSGGFAQWQEEGHKIETHEK